MAISADLSFLALMISTIGSPTVGTMAAPGDRQAALAGDPNYHGEFDTAAGERGWTGRKIDLRAATNGETPAAPPVSAEARAEQERLIMACKKSYRSLWSTPNPTEQVSGMPSFCDIQDHATLGSADVPELTELREVALRETNSPDFHW